MDAKHTDAKRKKLTAKAAPAKAPMFGVIIEFNRNFQR
jgi:hypothetical protein